VIPPAGSPFADQPIADPLVEGAAMTSPEPAPDVPPPEEAPAAEAVRELGDLTIPSDTLARITAALRDEARLQQRLGGDPLDPARGRLPAVSADSPLEQSDDFAREAQPEDH
jgi:hypothetical protein